MKFNRVLYGFVVLSFCALTLLIVGSCGGGANEGATFHYHKRGNIEDIDVDKTFEDIKGKYPINVVCTTGMVADLVQNIGKDHVKVIQLMPADSDPHEYQPKPSDESQLNSADVVFYSGIHLEGKMTDLFENLGKKKPVFPVAEYFDKEELISSDEGVDPHVWFDVELWNTCRAVVQRVLIKYDPANADEYKKNGDHYKIKLENLHRTVIADLDNSLPVKKRILVTSHDAFSYLGRKYNIQVKGIQGKDTTVETSIKHVSDLVEFVVKNKVKAVFVETSVNDRNMKSLVDGCKSNGHNVVIAEKKLFSDAMGQPGTAAGTYRGMIRHNIDAIIDSLK